jgi:hypothetical protein
MADWQFAVLVALLLCIIWREYVRGRETKRCWIDLGKDIRDIKGVLDVEFKQKYGLPVFTKETSG